MKKSMLVILVFVLIFGVVACENKGPVAIVNGVKITRQAFDTEVEYDLAEYRAQGIELSDEDIVGIKHAALDRLITIFLLKEAANVKGISVGDEDVAKHISQVQESFSDEAAFLSALTEEGFTLDSYKDTVLDILLIEALFEEELALSSLQVDEELIEEYVLSLLAYSEQDEGQEEIDEDDLREYAIYVLTQEKAQDLRNDYIEKLWQDSVIEFFNL